jgi:hypothetical protein
MPDAPEPLWGPDQLAAFLGYSVKTVIRMASGEPHKLPPRVSGLSKPRWVPELCRQWVVNRSLPTAATGPRRGRPRNVVSLAS